MFSERTLPDALERLRDEHAAGCLVLQCEQEFETMPAEWVYDLALVTEDIRPLSHPAAWIPEDAIPAIERTAGVDPAIGMPDDGSVTWTRQSEPPLVLVKPRASQLPDAFRQFLIAEALVEVGMGVPETPVCFFEERFPEVHAIMDEPTAAFQVAAALRRAWIGRQTRNVFSAWDGAYPSLQQACQDAGDRLAGRVEDIPTLLAENELAFAEATELACNAVKHGIALPAPFDALDVEAYVDQGAPYALRWLEEATA